MTRSEYSVEAQVGGKTWHFSTGKLAPQAQGAVLGRVGDTVVLGTVVLGKKPREGVDFLPLLVDYEEKLYAAGKIKGSRWVKREGRPSDDAVLAGRVIDRSLRPLFDERIRSDIQVVVTVLSADQENAPDMVGLNAAVAAIEVAGIPWDGPIASVRIGQVNGEFVLNPSFKQREEESLLDLVVAGTPRHIMMVEAGAKEVSEEVMLEAIKFSQQHMGTLLEAIKGLALKVQKPKLQFSLLTLPPEIETQVLVCKDKLLAALHNSKSRFQREEEVLFLKEQLENEIGGDDEEKKMAISFVFEKMMKKIVREKILQNEARVDGRKLEEIREVACEVGLLPRVHGSALFVRGDTQVLTTATLGGPGDEQLLEDIETEEERKKRYIHHYNMPGYASGEVAPMRAPARREIGHGALAERALLQMIPSKESFPYTIRLVSEVLSSNGSTSMAATCGSTLALMDAGIPIKAPISGIAMGLVLDEQSGKYKILTDILGLEDGCGHMDFKVAGTKTGITALQMDTKVKGLTIEILREALESAKRARLEILEKMLAVLPKPREKLSPYAPRIISLQINPEKIREVIGPSGKTINGIIAETGVKIDIEDSGLVMVTSTNEESSKRAVEWIKNLTREVLPGEVFEGKVTRIADFGAFVEILPGQDGLIHISELAPYRVQNVTDIVKVGDVVKVKVLNIDELGRINLSRKTLLPNHGSPKNPRPRMENRGARNRFSRQSG